MLAAGGCAADPDGDLTRPPGPSEQIAPILRGDGRRFVSSPGGFALPDAVRPALALTLPLEGSAPVRFRLPGDFQLDVVESGELGSAKVQDSAIAYPRRGGTSYWVASPDGYEEWLELAPGAVHRDAPLASWQLAGGTAQQHGDLVVIVDAAGRLQVTVSAPVAYGNGGRSVPVRLVAAEDHIDLFADANNEALLVDPIWTNTSPMNAVRYQAAAVRLLDGRVLITGGSGTSSAEVYDPVARRWTLVAPMNVVRQGHKALLLPDGRAVAAGGWYDKGLEIYDPATNTWTLSAPPPPSNGQYGLGAAVLQDGRVLMVHTRFEYAWDQATYPENRVAAIYDPATDTWTQTGLLNSGRSLADATVLADGRVLITGDSSRRDEIYDPATNTWAVPSQPRELHNKDSLIRLSDGRVLDSGGSNTFTYAGDTIVNTQDIYDPTSNTWTPAPNLGTQRYGQRASLQPNGEVLITGGSTSYAILSSTEVVSLTPGGITVSPGKPLVTARYEHQQIDLSDGTTLVMGGNTSGNVGISSSELLFPRLGFDKGPAVFSGAGSKNRDIALVDMTPWDYVPDLIAIAGNYVYTAGGLGNGTFGPAHRYTVGDTPVALAVAPIDPALQPLVFVVNRGSNDLTVRRPTVNGKLSTTAYTYPVGNQPSDVIVADVNGDGGGDAVVSNEGSGTISVLLHSSGLMFSAATSYPAGITGPRAMAAGDLDGNGSKDVALIGQGASVSLLFNNGNGTFQSPVSVALPFTPGAIAAADLDADGHLDLAASKVTGTDIAILLGNGDGTFKAPSIAAGGGSATALEARDVSGDGRPDLVTTDGATSTVSLAKGNGDGTFQRPVTVASSTAPVALAIADTDRDGRPDLAVTSSTQGYDLFRGNGDGTFQSSLGRPFGVGAIGAATADFNLDGHVDVAIANEGSSSVSVALGTGNGTFGAPYNVPVAHGCLTSVFADDLDGDGRPDLVAPDKCDNSVTVLRGNGDGSFHVTADLGNMSDPLGLAAADLNGDGRKDLIAAGSGSYRIYVMLGLGGGAFAAPVSYKTGASGAKPTHLALADLNGDGKLDVATSNQGANTVAVLLGNGAGAFGTAAAYAAPGLRTPWGIAAGDFNHDGKPDIAVAGKDSGNVTVFLNDGTGALGAGASYPVAVGLRNLLVKDLNSDGIEEIVVTNSTASTVSILEGVGNGTFHLPVIIPVGSGTRGLAWADLNEDGMPDLVAAGYNTNDVTPLLNTMPLSR